MRVWLETSSFAHHSAFSLLLLILDLLARTRATNALCRLLHTQLEMMFIMHLCGLLCTSSFNLPLDQVLLAL